VPGCGRCGSWGHPHRRILATAVLAGLALNAGLGWWWADPTAGYVLVFYAAREVRPVFTAR
jgi:divalent metal cation (Fe/Co/Zn/Cd) transporter